MVQTPPDRKVVGASPIDGGHGSYQCLWRGGGQYWRPTGRMVRVMVMVVVMMMVMVTRAGAPRPPVITHPRTGGRNDQLDPLTDQNCRGTRCEAARTRVGGPEAAKRRVSPAVWEVVLDRPPVTA